MADQINLDLRSLVFGHWDEPREAEPSYGHLIRCLDMNGQTRTASAAFQLDINGRNLKPDECLRIMLKHPMRDADTLMSNTPVIGRSVRLRGHQFSTKDWSLRFRRFCPGCLGESVHHRIWWDFRFMNVCPFHGRRIEGGVGSPRPVRWSSTDLAWSDGELLADPTIPRLDLVPLTIESYVLARLGMMPAHEPTTLDGFPLRAIIEATRSIGRLLVGGWKQTPPAMGYREGQLDPVAVYAIGFDGLVQGRGTLRSALKDVAAACPSISPGSRAEIGVAGLFGWGFKVLRDQVRNPLLRMATEVMIDIAVEDGRVRRHPVIVGGREGRFGRYTMKEAARLIGISSPALSSLAARVLPGFAEDRNTLRVHLSGEDVDAIREAKATALTRRSLARLLGLEARDITELEEEGFIRPCDAARSGGTGGRYLLIEVSALVDRIASAASGGLHAPRAEVPFRAYTKVRRLSSGRLAIEVLRGSVVPLRNLGASGFAGLTFDPGEGVVASVSYNGRRARLATGGLLIGETAVRLGISQPTVHELVGLGHLKIIEADKTGTGRDRIETESVEKFERVFVTAKSLAPLLECHPSGAVDRLRARGVRLTVEPGRPAQLTAIVRRDEVESLLVLHRAPEPPSAVREFWDYFRAEMRVRCPWIQPPPEPPSPAVPLWNSTRSLVVKLAVARNSISLTVECDPDLSPRRLSLFRERGQRLADLPDVAIGREGGRVRLFAEFRGFNPAQRSTWEGATVWIADRLAVLQSVFLVNPGRR